MTLLEREFPRIVENSFDPRPGVKRGSAFGRSYEEQRPCSIKDIPSPGHIDSSGLIGVNGMAS
jgi:hypothetical protein